MYVPSFESASIISPSSTRLSKHQTPIQPLKLKRSTRVIIDTVLFVFAVPCMTPDLCADPNQEELNMLRVVPSQQKGHAPNSSIVDDRMCSFENPHWILECPLIDELNIPAGDFFWDSHGLNSSSHASVEIDSPLMDSDGLKESGSRKRVRSESFNGPISKACREKMRRDKLNDKLLELGSILEPGKRPKTDKAAILVDAAHMVIQLRIETRKLKDSNENLQEKIKELKTEKNELREEKQKLKAEKESLEHQIKFLNARPSFIPHPPLVPAPAFAAQVKGAPPAVHKMMMPAVIAGYPGFHMWQLMPSSDVDTSKDVESCPPAA